MKEKIAVIGIAGKFPQANTVRGFWKNILEGRDCIIASNRWPADRVDSKNQEIQIKGGFIEDIEYFDADFFNISPKEAKLMDPQQRQLLQASYQAFEDAGFNKESLRGKSCGVFTTSLPGDYKYRLSNTENAYESFSFLGNATSVLPGRISYYYDLIGPSIYIDTACSSSLVCIDNASLYLKEKKCDYAFVGASSIFSSPEIFNLTRNSKILSKQGKCSTFDESADGFVPAEAVVGVVLCRESDAIAKNHQIYGTIEYSAVNHNGHSNGIMSPSPKAQKQLLENFYKDKLEMIPKIGYFEMHGTATQIGDPIETNTLNSILARYNGGKDRFYMGSTKANIGHALVASGLVSLIKSIMIFHDRVMPGQINYSRTNPEIDHENLTINTENIPWDSRKDFIGISAFGFAGTNAHILLKKPSTQYCKRINNDVYQFRSHKYWVEEQKDFSEVSTEKRIESNGNESELLTKSSNIPTVEHDIKKKLGDLLSYDIENMSSVKTFSEYGVDSLIAMQLVDQLGSYDKKVTPATFLKYNTIALLAEYLSDSENMDDSSSSKNISDKAPNQDYQYNNALPEESASNETKEYIDANIDKKILITGSRDSKSEWWISKKGNKPMVLLPPLNTNGKIWIQQIRYFITKGYKIYIPNYPGHQRTTFSQFSLYEIAELIYTDLLKFINGEKFTMIGWSIGGVFAAIIASRAAQHVDKLILTNTAPKFEDGIFEKSIQLRDELEICKNFLSNLFGKRKKEKQYSYANVADEQLMIDEVFSDAWNKEDITRFISEGCNLEQLGHYYEELQRFDMTDKLQNINVPTLIFHGNRDTVLHKRLTERFLEIPGSRYVELEAGHFIPLTDSFFFNRIIDQFINSACRKHHILL